MSSKLVGPYPSIELMRVIAWPPRPEPSSDTERIMGKPPPRWARLGTGKLGFANAEGGGAAANGSACAPPEPAPACCRAAQDTLSPRLSAEPSSAPPPGGNGGGICGRAPVLPDSGTDEEPPSLPAAEDAQHADACRSPCPSAPVPPSLATAASFAWAAATAGVSGSPGVDSRPFARESFRSRCRLFWNQTCT